MSGGLLLALLLAAAPEDRFVEGWAIFKDDSECFMASEFEGGTSIYFSEEWRTKKITIRVSDPRWKSLANRSGETVRADFNLSGRNVDYDHWYAEQAMIVANAEKDVYAVSAWWDGEEHAKDFWAAWALADGAEIKIDGKIIGRFNMTGTYKASLALAACTARALKNDRADPFDE